MRARMELQRRYQRHCGHYQRERQRARHDAASGKSRGSGIGSDRWARAVPGPRRTPEPGRVRRRRMIGFGIDLAGYTTGKTAIAAIEAKGHVGEAILLRQSHLSLPRSSTCEAATAVREDVECLRRCLRLGHVAVDVPICLQGLPYPSNPSEI